MFLQDIVVQVFQNVWISNIIPHGAKIYFPVSQQGQLESLVDSNSLLVSTSEQPENQIWLLAFIYNYLTYYIAGWSRFGKAVANDENVSVFVTVAS